jgi:predicted Rossmann fold flavoprotein
MKMTTTSFDIVVIGGGPAGIMAAGRAAECGAHVALLEKNDCLGKKLLITGGGRCNITNISHDIRGFTEMFGKGGKFLYPALHSFGVEETLSFFHTRGLKTKVEGKGCVFPLSDNAYDVLKVLESYLEKTRVCIIKNVPAQLTITKEHCIEKIITPADEITARSYIICTGGLSYSTTGSSGDGFQWGQQLGIPIVSPRPALTPVLAKNAYSKDLQGLSFPDLEIRIFQNNKKQGTYVGEIIFTHEGISGPAVLTMSKKIGELLQNGSVEVRIDFLPHDTYELFETKLVDIVRNHPNKTIKNNLDFFLPPKAVLAILSYARVKISKKGNDISKQERKNIVRSIKDFSLEVEGLSGFEKAMITAGGIALHEVDPKTMKAKRRKNIFFAGEVLDLDGPTGGYNLQVCWSTGYVAGDSAARGLSL